MPPRRRAAADKNYTAAELQHFEAYRDKRAKHRPRSCHHGERETPCWVKDGPPALGGNFKCIGCRSSVG